MWDWIAELSEIKKKGLRAVLVTVTHIKGSSPRDVGAKMVVFEDGIFSGTIGGGQLEFLALKDAQECFKTAENKTVTYPLCIKAGQCCGGLTEVLMEPINCGPHLFLFGAGHVAQAVCETLKNTPFTTHVIDERDEWIHADKLPSSVVRHSEPWEKVVEKLPWGAEKSFAAVMTHSHHLDQSILKNILPRPARYIGLIGSTTKWTRFRSRLIKEGIEEDALKRVRCPIGIIKAGKAPQEVAISFAAELLSLHYQPEASA